MSTITLTAVGRHTHSSSPSNISWFSKHFLHSVSFDSQNKPWKANLQKRKHTGKGTPLPWQAYASRPGCSPLVPGARRLWGWRRLTSTRKCSCGNFCPQGRHPRIHSLIREHSLGSHRVPGAGSGAQQRAQRGPAMGSSSSNGPQQGECVCGEAGKYPDRLRGSQVPHHLVFIAPDHLIKRIPSLMILYLLN